MKWLIRLCLCLPLLAQARTLTNQGPQPTDQRPRQRIPAQAAGTGAQPRGQPYKLGRSASISTSTASAGLARGNHQCVLDGYLQRPGILPHRSTNPAVSWPGRAASPSSTPMPRAVQPDQHPGRPQETESRTGVGWADNKILELAGIPTYAGRYSNLFRLMNDGDKLDFFPVVWWKSSPNAAAGGTISQPGDRSAPADPLPLRRVLLRQPGVAEAGQGDPDRPRRAYADGSGMAFFRENPRSAGPGQRQSGAESHHRPAHIPVDVDPLAQKSIPAQCWEYPPSQE